MGLPDPYFEREMQSALDRENAAEFERIAGEWRSKFIEAERKLSALRSARRTPTPLLVAAVAKAIMAALTGYRLNDAHLSDLLSEPDSETVATGLHQLDLLRGDVLGEVIGALRSYAPDGGVE